MKEYLLGKRAQVIRGPFVGQEAVVSSEPQSNGSIELAWPVAGQIKAERLWFQPQDVRILRSGERTCPIRAWPFRSCPLSSFAGSR